MEARVWYVAPWIVTALVMIPCSVIVGAFLTLEREVFLETWGHLWETQLPLLIFNTSILVIGVALGTFLLGTTLAWTVVMYDFPGKRLLDGGLLLPMAIPGYVIGIVALDHWDFSGTIPTALRQIGLGFPQIRSTWAVIMAMSLVLYPYVYIAARTAFREQSQTFPDLARNMGLNKVQVFWQVGIRLGRPTIMAGMALVIMETLADLGTVSIFAFDTMTTAIYETWFGLFQRRTAILR
ncbi:MAG: ABC transporter permease subunit [Pseudomonadota bacterium]